MLSDKLKAAGVKSADEVRSQSLWNGPQRDGPLGGITFSMLSRFLQCRERFRCYAIEGLKPRPQFNHRVEYGNMWHICEEVYGYGEDWSSSLAYYAASLCRKYPLQQQEIIKWRDVCCVQFPIYIEHWAKEEKRGEYKTLFTEDVFDVKYTLPSGRTVRLRGKRDKGLMRGNDWWLGEHKTKGDIDTELIPRQLTFDLQTMMYVVAIQEARYTKPLIDLIPKGSRLAGVLYNVVRRPLSGGKGTIVRHKATTKKPEETHESFYRRLKGIIDGTGEDAPGPKQFFYRWEVEVSSQDIERFKMESFNAILEQLCHWYEYQTGKAGLYGPLPFWALHFRMPYGVTALEEYGPSAYDRYLETGDTAGLEYVSTLFEELQV